MPENEYIFWRCPDGHLMGRVIKSKHGKVKIRQLEIFREALQDDPGLSEIIAITDGFTDVRCSICGKMRAWTPGGEELKEILVKGGVRVEIANLIVEMVE